MKRISIALSYLGLVVLFPQGLLAQDAEGCKDSPLVTRMQGSTIASCETKEFEQQEVAMKDKDGEKVAKTIEGDWHTWDYNTRAGSSQVQVYRNLANAMKNAGFTLDFTDDREELTAHKGNTWIYFDVNAEHYYQTVVFTKAMEQEVTADAASLSDEIAKSGHVAVYGINFETGKATIKGESENILGEIVKLMQQNPDLKLRVEGHTDNQGAAAANQALSEKRAQGVVAWLTAHGVAGSRLTAKGMGQTEPVADNGTEAGRAKNRRVELVKQ